jgi:hypothetical protein
VAELGGRAAAVWDPGALLNPPLLGRTMDLRTLRSLVPRLNRATIAKARTIKCITPTVRGLGEVVVAVTDTSQTYL